MAARKSFLWHSPSRRNKIASFSPVVEEVGEGDEAIAPEMATPTPKLTRSHRSNRLSSFLSSPSKFSFSPTKAKLVEEYTRQQHQHQQHQYQQHQQQQQHAQQPPRLPAKLSKHALHTSSEVPHSPPTAYSHPPSSGPPRQEHSSRPRGSHSSGRLPIQPSNEAAHPQKRERASSLSPPMRQNGTHSRVASLPTASGPVSFHADQEANRAGRKTDKKGWLGLSRSRNASQELDPSHSSTAWVNIGGRTLDYNLDFLVHGEKVSNVLVGILETRC